MSRDIIERVVTKVLNREFRSRTELAKYLGVTTGYVSQLRQSAVEIGLVDSKQWASSFRTGKNGQRGPDKNPRKPRIGAATKRVMEVLEQEDTVTV